MNKVKEIEELIGLTAINDIKNITNYRDYLYLFYKKNAESLKIIQKLLEIKRNLGDDCLITINIVKKELKHYNLKIHDDVTLTLHIKNNYL